MKSLAKIEKRMAEESAAPLYMRLQRAIRAAIEENVWSPNDVLPAERELAGRFSLSRVTVRKAIDGLVDEGILTRRQGAGTFVASRVEKSFAQLSSFTEDMRARGRTVRSEWLNRSQGAVTPTESLMFGLSPGTPVYRFNRIRYADESPMAIEYSTIPAFCLKSINAVKTSLYAALEENGCRPARALQRLRAVNFTREQAELIGTPEGAAGLLIERRGFAGDGRTVEITQSYYRGDAYDFVAELSLAK
jgi:GntR family transcriptional regulator